MRPVEATLEITPCGRLHVADVRALAAETHGQMFDSYARCVYCSLHTTAGYLPQSLTARLRAGSGGVRAYIELFRTVFPEGAGYLHDDLARRDELTPDQREVESRNGDSHLAFIGGGLRACVSYRTTRSDPVYLIDLDGVQAGSPRLRRTMLVGYNDELEVAQVTIGVPVSSHPIDAINLKEPRLGVYEQIADLIARHGITKGRARLVLAPEELGASLTVNEYETLLMHHDLADVLRNPLRFALEKGRHMWNDPGAVPFKAIDYAKYDLVHAVNFVVATLGLGSAHIERLLSSALTVPASRFLRAKRCVDLLVSDSQSPGRGRVVEGKYQTPIMIQWRGTTRRTRFIQVRLSRFV
jgi:thiamine phosphate synthase YjbQ (UPF0047 family)